MADSVDNKGGDASGTAKPAQKSLKKEKKVETPLSKIGARLLQIVESPLFVGACITAVFVYFAATFYEVRGLNSANQVRNAFTRAIYQAVEGLDFLLTDMRFLVRGEKKSEARVALIAIDDRSVEEVGRWPWSREKIAHITDQIFAHGGRAIGFDIINSEPQENPIPATLKNIEAKTPLTRELKQIFSQEISRPGPDDAMAASILKNQDKIVLGVFDSDNTEYPFEPYQDYCLNEAFASINAAKFVKIENVTFVVEDRADPFEQLDFKPLFDALFPEVRKNRQTHLLLNDFKKASVDELNSFERKKLDYLLERSMVDYCKEWLGPKDPYIGTTDKFFEQNAEKIPVLKGLSGEAATNKFAKTVLSHPMRQKEGWTINIDKYQDAAIYSANFSAEQDADGKIRVNPLFYRTGNRLGTSFVPSLALQTYLTANPGYQALIQIDVDPKQPDQKTIKSFIVTDLNTEKEVMKIPVDGQGRLKINYAGGTNMFPYVPAKELLTDSPTMRVTVPEWHPELKRSIAKEVEVQKAEFLKDRTFLIGATAVGVYDLRVTPFEKNFPGPETHLTVLANLMDQNFIRVDPEESTRMIWVLAVFGLLLTAAVAYSGAFLGFFVTLVFEALLIFLDQYLMKQGLVTTMILPALLGFSIYVLLTLYKYFTEERKKKYLRSTFSKYVSPAVVDEILRDPENIELGGKKVRMSVSFSDVRGFTTISEKLEPQVLSDVLNHYLTPMTNIVFANKGTLDKYMGDAIMSFFGAPIGFPDHAAHACRCALQSLVKLKEIQDEFVALGYPPIDIGIGINTGDMSVGNMGSDVVRSYTVMGDAVNLGSRLEGINKEYGTRIIISEFTYNDVKDTFIAREVDMVRVKGKLEPVHIFELIAEGAQPPADWTECLEHFRAGYGLYHEKKFEEASARFQEALRVRPGDPVSELYVERCAEYIAEPPPSDWDGVHVMKTK